jgi:zona occludens toxin (predicted ATPase)
MNERQLDSLRNGRLIVTVTEGLDVQAISQYLGKDVSSQIYAITPNNFKAFRDHDFRKPLSPDAFDDVAESYESDEDLDEALLDYIRSPAFWYHPDRNPGAVTRPGCHLFLDEFQNIWGEGEQLPNHARVYFTKHRHYIDPVSHVSTDIDLCFQVFTSVPRIIRKLATNTFHVVNWGVVGLMAGRYTLTSYTGGVDPTADRAAKFRIRRQWRKYNPAIFKLYDSYHGGKKGKELIKGVSMFRSFTFFVLPFAALFIWFTFQYISGWVSGVMHKNDAKSPPHAQSANRGVASEPSPVSNASLPKPITGWTYVGSYTTRGIPIYVLVSDSGQYRYIPGTDAKLDKKGASFTLTLSTGETFSEYSYHVDMTKDSGTANLGGGVPRDAPVFQNK